MPSFAGEANIPEVQAYRASTDRTSGLITGWRSEPTSPTTVVNTLQLLRSEPTFSVVGFHDNPTSGDASGRTDPVRVQACVVSESP